MYTRRKKSSKVNPEHSETRPIYPDITDPDLVDAVEEEEEYTPQNPQNEAKSGKTGEKRGWMTTIYENKLLLLIGFLIVVIIVIVGFLVLRRIEEPPVAEESLTQQKNIHKYPQNYLPNDRQHYQHIKPDQPVPPTQQPQNYQANYQPNDQQQHQYYYQPANIQQNAYQNTYQNANQQNAYQNTHQQNNTPQKQQNNNNMFDNVMNMLNSGDVAPANRPNSNPPPKRQSNTNFAANDRIKDHFAGDVRSTDNLPRNNNISAPNVVLENPPAIPAVLPETVNPQNPEENYPEVLVEEVMECDVAGCSNDVYLNNKCYSHYTDGS